MYRSEWCTYQNDNNHNIAIQLDNPFPKFMQAHVIPLNRSSAREPFALLLQPPIKFWLGRFRVALASEYCATSNAYTEDIDPTLRKVEQVRVE